MKQTKDERLMNVLLDKERSVKPAKMLTIKQFYQGAVRFQNLFDAYGRIVVTSEHAHACHHIAKLALHGQFVFVFTCKIMHSKLVQEFFQQSLKRLKLSSILNQLVKLMDS